MKQYLFLLRAGRPMDQKSDAENKADNEAWGQYMGKLTTSGQWVGGMPLVSGGNTVTSSGTTGQPVSTPKEGIVGGYLLVKAENLEKATELAKQCPHISNEGNIEIREIAPMPAM